MSDDTGITKKGIKGIDLGYSVACLRMGRIGVCTRHGYIYPYNYKYNYT